MILSDEQYDRFARKWHRPKSLVQFFRESPLLGVDLDLERDRDPARDNDLTENSLSDTDLA
jgi:hypothetical protein